MNPSTTTHKADNVLPSQWHADSEEVCRVLLIIVPPSTLPKTLKGQDKKEEKRLDTCTQDGRFCDHAGNDSAPAHKLTTME